MRPVLLDLFCKEGGAAKGYHDAGFDVVGVDIKPQPRYPYEFHQADALEFFAAHWQEFDAYHGSPPCQAHSALARSNPHTYADFIPQTRAMFAATGRPWAIENVEGAPLVDPITLCGSMFDLGTAEYELRRHRLFESNITLPQPACRHGDRPVIGVYGGKARLRRRTPHWGTNLPKADGEQAMGINWMTNAGLSEAIPPAYSRWIGEHLIAAIPTGQLDLLVLAAMAADHLGHPLAQMPATHRVALDAVTWPEMPAPLVPFCEPCAMGYSCPAHDPRPPLVVPYQGGRHTGTPTINLLGQEAS